MRANRLLLLGLCAIFALGLCVSCSSGPQPPRAGTPAFYWASAKQAYQAGDNLKTLDALDSLTRTDNEYTARARVWEIVVSSGVAQGYMELADNFEKGARANRQNPMPFRKQVTVMRAAASNAALQFAEAFRNFQDASKDPNVALVFDYPAGNFGAPAEIGRVTSGILATDAEVEKLQRAMLQRGVLLSVCRAVGTPDDAPKALEIFKKGNVQTPRETLLLNMARLLNDEAQLFGPDKLDQPQRVKLLCAEALRAISALPPSKATKDLTSKIQATMKKSKIS